MNSQTRVIVGMSGGVDSSVAALLLKQQGYDVHGLHMTNWDQDDSYCTAAQDLQDARKVSEQIGIPLHHVNFAREYREQVFQYFLDEYAQLRTPNPDVLCNREIKFGVFREYAGRLGGDFIATGHYARIEHTAEGVRLLKGSDTEKDQSYFLHAVAADAFAKTLFPLGELTKPQIRALAFEHGLATRAKKDSTGICFIGERPFREFLAGYLPARPGPIVDEQGHELGEHGGLMYYTLGQRQGLGIGGHPAAREAPWYVAERRLADNALLVVQRADHPLLMASELVATDCHWIGGRPTGLAADSPLQCQAKIRYRQTDQDCTVSMQPDGTLQVRFARPQRAVAPGQFVVFYKAQHCLGGAVIQSTSRLAESRLKAS